MPGFNANLHLRAWVGTPRRKRLMLDQPAHSILGNFLVALACQLANSGIYGQFKNYGGTLITPIPASKNFMIDTTAGANCKAIGVGTLATPVTLADFTLPGLIQNGSGAGQLIHNVTSFAIIGKAVGAWTFAITKTFTNNSTGAISVQESGLWVNIVMSGATDNIVLIIRDVFGAVSVGQGKILTMEYTVEIPLL